ncbi:MAG: 50S ribosomal protein L31 [Chloroflexi bacterium]|jgi:large subunit ribosomal protein L31|nr:50S ribosomal protein L31 [Chloroflexota bacterium]MBT4074317.1 50S ribosomal protein L31 [Chloroflexota bacterium]MBT4514317.1 50S ribosomal protein L31 [Chloroflexota bacterium]MBT5318414.1 50S ribosomal protein L31 [Chloroflexota bacterium]MBT6682915.1 50S ribosomal protein L31 [Chloroflexota bacterium]
MKTEIHPEYHADAQVTCACGNTWTTGSTSAELRVALCSNCHPFYTGEQRIVDTEGRVERLMRRFNLGSAEEAAKLAEETAERSAAAEAEAEAAVEAEREEARAASQAAMLSGEAPPSDDAADEPEPETGDADSEESGDSGEGDEAETADD